MTPSFQNRLRLLEVNLKYSSGGKETSDTELTLSYINKSRHDGEWIGNMNPTRACDNTTLFSIRHDRSGMNSF